VIDFDIYPPGEAVIDESDGCLNLKSTLRLSLTTGPISLSGVQLLAKREPAN
jgi:hypothetical protein